MVLGGIWVFAPVEKPAWPWALLRGDRSRLSPAVASSVSLSSWVPTGSLVSFSLFSGLSSCSPHLLNLQVLLGGSTYQVCLVPTGFLVPILEIWMKVSSVSSNPEYLHGPWNESGGMPLTNHLTQCLLSGFSGWFQDRTISEPQGMSRGPDNPKSLHSVDLIWEESSDSEILSIFDSLSSFLSKSQNSSMIVIIIFRVCHQMDSSLRCTGAWVQNIPLWPLSCSHLMATSWGNFRCPTSWSDFFPCSHFQEPPMSWAVETTTCQLAISLMMSIGFWSPRPSVKANLRCCGAVNRTVTFEVGLKFLKSVFFAWLIHGHFSSSPKRQAVKVSSFAIKDLARLTEILILVPLLSFGGSPSKITVRGALLDVAAHMSKSSCSWCTSFVTTKPPGKSLALAKAPRTWETWVIFGVEVHSPEANEEIFPTGGLPFFHVWGPKKHLIRLGVISLSRSLRRFPNNSFRVMRSRFL